MSSDAQNAVTAAKAIRAGNSQQAAEHLAALTPRAQKQLVRNVVTRRASEGK